MSIFSWAAGAFVHSVLEDEFANCAPVRRHLPQELKTDTVFQEHPEHSLHSRVCSMTIEFTVPASSDISVCPPSGRNRHCGGYAAEARERNTRSKLRLEYWFEARE